MVDSRSTRAFSKYKYAPYDDNAEHLFTFSKHKHLLIMNFSKQWHLEFRTTPEIDEHRPANKSRHLMQPQTKDWCGAHSHQHAGSLDTRHASLLYKHRVIKLSRYPDESAWIMSQLPVWSSIKVHPSTEIRKSSDKKLGAGFLKMSYFQLRNSRP